MRWWICSVLFLFFAGLGCGPGDPLRFDGDASAAAGDDDDGGGWPSDGDDDDDDVVTPGECGGTGEECLAVEILNGIRAEQEPALAPLLWNAKLSAAARSHNEWMAEHGCFAHDCEGEPTVAQRIAEAGYGAWGWGETIAAGYLDAPGVIDGWMNSPPHKAILLGHFEDIGISHLQCEDCVWGVYWTANVANGD